jgi:DNA-binding MarR family transcriptional regulator
MARHHVDFFDALVRYETVLWNDLDLRLQADLGLTLARLQALRVIDRRDGACRVQDIADDLCITVGAASKLVDRLETDDLAHRAANPGDRRSSLITFSDKGRSIHDAGVKRMDGHLRVHLSASFDHAEVAELTTRMSAARHQLRSTERRAST